MKSPSFTASMLLSAALCWPTAGGADTNVPMTNRSIRIRVVGPDGQPVGKALVTGNAHSENACVGVFAGVSDKTGLASVGIPSLPENMVQGGLALDLVVTSEKHPFAELHIDRFDEGMEETVTLEGGKPIRVAFSGGSKPLPTNARIAAFTPATAERAIGSLESRRGVYTIAPTSNTGKGEWSLILPERTPDFWIAIDEPGCLRGFVHGPITQADLDRGSLMVQLPDTGSIEASYSLPQGEKTEKRVDVTLSRAVSFGARGGAVPFPIGHKFRKGTSISLGSDHLAPGDYTVAGSHGQPIGQFRLGTDFYQIKKDVSLAPGARETINLVYTPFSPDIFNGDRDVRLTIKNVMGAPASRAKWMIRAPYGLMGYQTVREGETDAKGIAEIAGLKGGADSPRYTVVIGDAAVGAFDLKDDTKQREFDFSLPLGTGDLAPEMTLTSLETGKSLTLSSLRGQVVFLDFWATWCGPCQEPMAHNSEVLKKRGADWQGKATILAVSCDNTMEILRKHVTAKGWENVPQYWAGEGSFGSKPFRDYVITGVPTAFLIDKEGKIVWTGHPAMFDLDGEIDKLLAAK